MRDLKTHTSATCTTPMCSYLVIKRIIKSHNLLPTDSGAWNAVGMTLPGWSCGANLICAFESAAERFQIWPGNCARMETCQHVDYSVAEPGGYVSEDDGWQGVGMAEVYRNDYRVRSGIAHGGIGAGSVELRKNGVFTNWRIANNWPLGPAEPIGALPQPRAGVDIDREESFLFFVVRIQVEGRKPFLKLLQLPNGRSAAGTSYDPVYIFPWLTPVEQIEYSARFPFSWLTFTDPDMPAVIELEAFSPFIPHDVENSSLPGVFFRFSVGSECDKRMHVTLVGTLRNLVGYDVCGKLFASQRTETDDYVHFSHSRGGMDEAHDTFGSMGMASLSPDSSYYLGWEHMHPFYEQLLRNRDLPNIDDTEGKDAWLEQHPEQRERLEWLPATPGRNAPEQLNREERTSRGNCPEQIVYGSVARSATLEPGRKVDHTFILTWHFPNRYTSPGNDLPSPEETDNTRRFAGHFYANRFADAAAVAEFMARENRMLTTRTHGFLDAFYASSAPEFVLDQVNSHLNTLITNSHLAKDGRFGIMDDGGLPEREGGSMHGCNPDVSVYSSGMLIALFPELQQSAMRGIVARQRDNGALERKRSDWPGDCIQQILRDYLWTEDKGFLRELWPNVRRFLDYALTELDIDGDGLPDISGNVNHCSYDNLPMYGLAAYVGSQWLSALRHVAETGADAGDEETALRAAQLFESARATFVERLWNGRFFRIYDDPVGGRGTDDGCLADQLLGQWMARQSGLGDIVDRDRIQSALKEILRLNFEPGFMLRNCTWEDQIELDTGLCPVPPNTWNDQANTPWSGVELAFAALLLYEDRYEDALAVIEAVDRRYRKAGLYFDHHEAYGHYERPMSAWSIVNALLGLSVNRGAYTFAPRIPLEDFTLFFAVPTATAHYIGTPGTVTIRILTGELRPARVTLPGTAVLAVQIDDTPVGCHITASGGRSTLKFDDRPVLAAGRTLHVKLKMNSPSNA